MPPEFDTAIATTRVIHFSEIAHHYRDLMANRRPQFSERFREFYDDGLKYSATDYLAALRTREALRESLATFLEGYDAIVTPPATGEPPRGLEFTGDANFCTIWTLCGVPCVSFPTGRGPNGLPMGLQVIGRYLADGAALGVAKWCVEQLPFRLDTLD